MAKTDTATAYRQLKSPNKVTRARALRIIKEAKKQKLQKQS
ncbi:putative metal homeostasis protein [Paenibacillus wenxiniae]|uniref:Metal homeostasis protein n=1 Tax=Paenibacillus wenxiniae TaxID=1636843 RepID=A0ABW4RH05_9BACL